MVLTLLINSVVIYFGFAASVLVKGGELLGAFVTSGIRDCCWRRSRGTDQYFSKRVK